MYRNFHHFTTKTLDKKYVSAKGSVYKKTVVVSFYDTENHLITTEDYGEADLESVYAEIGKDKQITLDEAYIKNFSITAWRRLNIIDKKDIVDLKNIQANHAFFDVYSCIDFSYIQIKGGHANFKESIFYGGGIDMQQSRFLDTEVDFSYIALRKGGLNFDSIRMEKGQLNFKNAILGTGEKNFQYAHFNETPVDFTNCEFKDGDINMVDAHFSGGLSFKVSRVGKGKIGFQFARFSKKDVSFDRASFGNGDIDFRTTEFTGIKANFNRCSAGNGSWDFTGAEVSNGKMTFKKTDLGSGRISFTEAIFRNTDLNFSRAETQEALMDFEKTQLSSIDLSYCFFNRYLNFRFECAEQIDLTNAVVRDILDMHVPKSGKPAPVIFFTGMSLPGLLYINWEKNKIEQAIYNQGDKTTHHEKSTQFLMIKENFNRNGQYEDEDLAYVEYRRCIARSRRYDGQKKIWSKISDTTVYLLDRLLLDYTGLYGTSPLRVFLTMISFYILFSLGYLLIIYTGAGDIVVSVGEAYNLSFWSKGFYHSAITMLTIGYGDHFPTGLARGVSAIQGFVGMLLLSYFTVSLVHKILR